MDDPFCCFGSDSDDDNAIVSQNMEQGRRLVTAANARQANASTIHLPLFPNSNFEVFQDANGGKGLRALRSYKCGDEITREGAAMRVPSRHAASNAAEAEEKFKRSVQSNFETLPSATQKSVMDLSCCDAYTDDYGAATLVGVYQTNSFRLGNETDSGLFLTVSRINHSCRPNSNHFWRPDLQMTLVFASRDIDVGEEICTTYGPSESMSTVGRQKYLNDRFSFDCMCEMCREGNAMGGDDRMVELNSLYEDISFYASGGKPEEAIRAVNRCLELLGEQGIGVGAFTKPILHYGYQISLTGLHNETMAKTYLERELVAVKSSEGAGSDRAIDIQSILDDMPTR